DADGDGINNSRDFCALTKEDRDGFQDNDGCPEKDNDNDRIVDTRDKWPLQPEDWDGYMDNDGCPEIGWGKCGAGSNGPDCPLPIKPTVIWDTLFIKQAPDTVVIKPLNSSPDLVLFFRNNKWEGEPPDSIELAAFIDQVQNGDINKLRIDAHTDNTGSAEYNQRLSEKRAIWVIDFLKASGLSEAVSGRGLGMFSPLNLNATELEKADNRRVEIWLE
ncbi:MAG: OmpA family protein, partial [Flavobacteriales bacterium]|nr:OmpA family protein [Flavobacteriales bacterium]